MKYTLITLAALSSVAFAQSTVFSDSFDGATSSNSWNITGDFNFKDPLGAGGLGELGRANVPTTASSDFSTLSGGNYSLSLSFGTYSPGTYPSAGPWNFDVVFLDALTDTEISRTTFDAFNASQSGNYATELTGSTSFTAPSASTRLMLDSTPYGHGWITVDNISVTGPAPVPEPSSAALLGLGGFAFILRRRK